MVRKRVGRKVAESVAVVVAAVGLMLFGTLGEFTEENTRFPVAVVVDR